MQTIPIRITIKTKGILKKLKVNRETYDDVLQRLIKFFKEQNGKF